MNTSHDRSFKKDLRMMSFVSVIEALWLSFPKIDSQLQLIHIAGSQHFNPNTQTHTNTHTEVSDCSNIIRLVRLLPSTEKTKTQ